jgi:hypothetical protein
MAMVVVIAVCGHTTTVSSIYSTWINLEIWILVEVKLSLSLR